MTQKSPRNLGQDKSRLPFRLLQLLVGVWYLPHVYSKLTKFDATVEFFSRVGLRPATLFVIAALCAESLVAIGMVTGRYIQQAAMLSICLMLGAVYANVAATGFFWYWPSGGIEYVVFWGIVSAIVLIDERVAPNR